VDHDWDGWPEDGYGHDTGDTADLGDHDGSLSDAGLGGYEEPGGGEPGPPGGDAGGHITDSAGAGGGDEPPSGGGYLEDDPMGGFADHDADADAGLGDADAGPGDTGPADADADTGPGDADTGPADAGHLEHVPQEALESVVGADPDVDPAAEWTPAEFPEQLDVTPPEPVDGYPWSDALAVAAPGSGGADPASGPDASAPAEDLLDYAGADAGDDPWSALLGSDDPATSSLGRWWAPGA
jgi:hypothetical protein